MLEKIKINGTQLKLIAIITMLIDHIGAAILEKNSEVYAQYYMQSDFMRTIGRMAFPIFCYLSVQGFLHTKNIKKYILRLFVFALLAEVPFDLAFFDSYFYVEYNNVIWSILLGIMMLAVIRKYEQKSVIVMAAVAAALTLGYVLKTDYLYIAPLLMGILYQLRYNKKKQMVAGAALMFFLNVTSDWIGAVMTVLSFVCVWFYDGKKGRGWKYFFYIFYPAHLLILYVIRKGMFG